MRHCWCYLRSVVLRRWYARLACGCHLCRKLVHVELLLKQLHTRVVGIAHLLSAFYTLDQAESNPGTKRTLLRRSHPGHGGGKTEHSHQRPRVRVPKRKAAFSNSVVTYPEFFEWTRHWRQRDNRLPPYPHFKVPLSRLRMIQTRVGRWAYEWILV